MTRFAGGAGSVDLTSNRSIIDWSVAFCAERLMALQNTALSRPYDVANTARGDVAGHVGEFEQCGKWETTSLEFSLVGRQVLRM